jgi:hypothetical protein
VTAVADDDDLVRQLRQALAVDHLGASPAPARKDPPPVAAMSEEMPSAPRRAPVGATALGIADELLGFIPSYERPAARIDLALRRGGAIHSIPATGLVLGRRAAPGALVVDDRHVSREHARVVDIDGSLQIVDVGSSNGTAILRGGVRIDVGSSAVALEAGDRIVTVNDVELVDVVVADGQAPA